jgi:hypothetical protein
MPITRVDGEWIDISDGKTICLSFQHAPDHQSPRWLDRAFPQQVHIDVIVEDIDQAEAKVIALGARRPPCQGSSFRVYADLAGHTFFLCRV